MVLVAVALLATPVLAEDTPQQSDTPSGDTFRRSGSLLDRSPQHRSQMLSVFLGLPYGYFYYGGVPFGLGARYLIPIVHDGFLSAVNDSFNIEFGVDFSGVMGRTFYPVLSIPVELMWQFHFTPKFSAYAKVGIALEFNLVSYCSVGYCRTVVTAGGIGGVGLMYKFTDKISFRAELGYPWVKVGLGFDM
jgi:hypothetical protein